MAGAGLEPDMLTTIIRRYPGFTWGNAEFINPETFRDKGVDAAVREAYRTRDLEYALKNMGEFINPETLEREGKAAAVREAYDDMRFARAVRSAARGRGSSELRRALEEEVVRPPMPNTTGLSRKEKDKVKSAYYRRVAELERRHELYWRRQIWRILHPDAPESEWKASEERRRATRKGTHKRVGGARRRTARRPARTQI